MRDHLKPLLFVLLLIIVSIADKKVAVAQVEIEMRSLSGTAAPIATPPVNFDTFQDPSIADDGSFRFQADLTGFVNSGNRVGLFVADSQGGALSIRTGDPVGPNSSNVTIENLGNVNSNMTGASAYLAELDGSGIGFDNDMAVLITDEDGSRLLFQEGDSVTTGAVISSFRFFDFSPIVNRQGETVVSVFLSGAAVDSSNNEAIVRYQLEEGNVSLIAREGTPSPVDGFLFGNFLAQPRINLSASTAFVSELRSTDSEQASSGVFLADNSTLQPIAVVGDPAPIAGENIQFGGAVQEQVFGASPGLNHAGDVAFVADLTGPSVADNDFGIFLYSKGSISTIGRLGDPLNSNNADCSLVDIVGPLVLNQASQLAVRGQLVDQRGFGFREAILSNASGSLGVVAATGDPAPQTAAGVVFGSPFPNNNFGDPVINGAGQIAFFAMLQGPNVDNNNNSGIWASDASGQLNRIIRSGQQLDVSRTTDSDFRTVQFVGRFRPSGGEDGLQRVLNDNGQLVFCVEFTDGSQAVIVADTLGQNLLDVQLLSADLAPVPVEPIVFDDGTFDLEPAFIDNAGQVAFQADVDGPEISFLNDTVLFAGPANGLKVIAREDDPIPGFFDIRDIQDYELSGHGNLMYRLDLDTFTCVTFQYSDGVSRPIVEEDRPLFDDLPGLIIDGFSLGVPNENGDVVFSATYSGDDVDFLNDQAIIVISNQVPQEAISERQSVLDLPGVELQSFQAPGHFTPSGEFSVTSRLIGTDVTIDNDDAIFRFTQGKLELVAREGDTAPFLASGVFFDDLFESRMTADNRISIFVRLDGNGINSSNEDMIVAYVDGELLPMVRDGDPIPGSDAEVRVNSTYSQNDFGQILMQVSLVGPGVSSSNDNAIVLVSDNGIELVAREGDQVTGLPSGVVYSSFENNNSLNNAGQVVFVANLAGPGIGASNNQGIWATDADGDLISVIAEGDIIDVNNDPNIQDFRQVTSLEVPFTESGGNDGRASFFNDRGQVAIKLRLTNQTTSQGIFVANTIPIEFLLGDVNRDGVVDLLDIQPFVDLITSNQFQEEADMNQDGQVDLLDVGLFVLAILGN